MRLKKEKTKYKKKEKKHSIVMVKSAPTLCEEVSHEFASSSGYVKIKLVKKIETKEAVFPADDIFVSKNHLICRLAS
jgi:hypothetical protein